MSTDEWNWAESDEQLATRDQTRARRPRRFRVLLHNDDYTTMDFVVHVLAKHFHKSTFEANKIMMTVHEKGVGVAGVFTYDVAETKVALVTRDAEESGMPLLCTMEAE